MQRAWETGAAREGPLLPAGLQRQASQPPPLSDSTNVVGFQLNVRPDPLSIPERSMPGEPASTVTSRLDHRPDRASSIEAVLKNDQKTARNVEESDRKASPSKSQWRLYGSSRHDSTYPRSYQPIVRPYQYYTSSLQPVTLLSSATYHPTLPTPSPAVTAPQSTYQQSAKPRSPPAHEPYTLKQQCSETAALAEQLKILRSGAEISTLRRRCEAREADVKKLQEEMDKAKEEHEELLT